MTGFSADWLALREPYDAQARNAEVLDAAVRSLSHLPAVSIVDLACGTGSTLRAVGPRIKARQSWKFIDNDLSLLGRALERASQSGAAVTGAPVDLARDLELALDGLVDLVTTSALLDLVSEDWLERLATEVAARQIPIYAALTYDGTITLTPTNPLDAAVVAAVNKHQRNDKGFGPALGSGAAEAASARFKTVGYSVVGGRSDWVFGPQDQEIQLQVLSGWAHAARETRELSTPAVDQWLQQRNEIVEAGGSQIRVGHLDLFAQPSRRE
jgi:SAM-dependent methyltransferase